LTISRASASLMTPLGRGKERVGSAPAVGTATKTRGGEGEGVVVEAGSERVEGGGGGGGDEVEEAKEEEEDEEEEAAAAEEEEEEEEEKEEEEEEEADEEEAEDE